MRGLEARLESAEAAVAGHREKVSAVAEAVYTSQTGELERALLPAFKRVATAVERLNETRHRLNGVTPETQECTPLHIEIKVPSLYSGAGDEILAALRDLPGVRVLHR